MLRRTALAAVALAALTLTACTAQPPPVDDRPLVVTTFTVLADMASVVAGDDLRVESIIKPGAEIHAYEPTPGDIRRAADADLVLDNGLGLEGWFAQFIDSVAVPHVVVSDGVDPIDIADDAYAGQPNPHAWMSPLSALVYVDNIVAAFGELDPENAQAYAERGAQYQEQLQLLHDELVTELGALEADQRALVTCEGAFSYLARDAGLTEVYLWPVNAEQQATPQRVAGVIDVVEERDIPAVFCESTVSDRAMREVAAATGARFGGTLYVDSLSEPGGPVPTYLDLLRHDADTIVAGLAGATS